MTKLDGNKDGSITKLEFEKGNAGRNFTAAYLDQQFKLVDTNKDGSISKDEMKTFITKKMSGGMQMWHHSAAQ